MPSAPQPQPGRPAKSQSKTLVGGLPWERSAEPAPAESAVPGMPAIAPADPRGKPSRQPDDEPADQASWRQRLDDWVRRSPPVLASLSLHVVALIILAVIFSRREEPDAISLDLSFASEEIVEQEDDKGVQIVAPEEPEEPPVEEQAATEEPPTEDPVAAPATVEEIITDTGAGATTEPVPHNVPLGTLLDGRQEGRREALVRAFGGSDATEAAVSRALAWLVRQQQKDGLWSLQGPYLDGGSQENQLAATAMALLAFQGAGSTPRGGRHKQAVARAWQALVKRQEPDGRFDVRPLPSHHALYAHAQATYALCELYGMTKDDSFAEPARRAVAFAVAAQGPNGGWRYLPGEAGDMSVTGWFMMALKSAEMAGLEVPPETYDAMTSFVDGVSLEGGSRYGYRLDSPQRPPTGVTPAVCAEGLLSRQFLGWGRDDRRLAAGLEFLVAEKLFDFENDKDVYAWYYITQVVHNVGGPAWDLWNARMREALPQHQSTEGPEKGSWDPALDKWGHIGGRLFTTCFCTWMLEVYYRHLPLYGAVAND